jgi:hypothetical protein
VPRSSLSAFGFVFLFFADRVFAKEKLLKQTFRRKYFSIVSGVESKREGKKKRTRPKFGRKKKSCRRTRHDGKYWTQRNVTTAGKKKRELSVAWSVAQATKAVRVVVA